MNKIKKLVKKIRHYKEDDYFVYEICFGGTKYATSYNDERSMSSALSGIYESIYFLNKFGEKKYNSTIDSEKFLNKHSVGSYINGKLCFLEHKTNQINVFINLLSSEECDNFSNEIEQLKKEYPIEYE